MERIMLDALPSAIGRFPKTVPMLAAHAPAMGKLVPPSPGTFPSYRGLFVGFLVGGGLIIGGLAFAPAFTLGPVAGNMTIPASSLS
jgi:K+-transporting ATPase ATPase A chain